MKYFIFLKNQQKKGPLAKKFNKDKFGNKDFSSRKTFGDSRTGFKKSGLNNRFAGRSVGARQGYGNNNRAFASNELRKGPGGRGRGTGVRRPNMNLGSNTG